MYFLIVYGKKGLFYETFEDKTSLEEHINSRKRFFHKKFKNNQAYIVRGEEIFTVRRHLDEEIDDSQPLR
jgi:quinol monooxygenase YgiN